MSPPMRAVVAIFNDAAHAHLNFESLVEFDESIPFDAALAAKTDAGRVEIQREHRAHGLSAKLIHASAKSLAVSLLSSLGDGDDNGKVATGAEWLRIPPDQNDRFREIANGALDSGEALIALVCAAEEAERFDQLLVEARQVLQLDADPIEP